MPHVVIQGNIAVEDIWMAFAPTEFTERGARFKAEEAYLSRTKDALMIRSLTVQRGFVKNFFIRISQKEPGTITIGLERLARPEINDAVKRLIGLYTWQILQSAPECTVQSSNIQEFVREPVGE